MPFPPPRAAGAPLLRLLLGLTLAAAPAAPAGDDALRPLAELERRALAESPVLAAARAELAALRAEARAAGAYEDPMLEVDGRWLVPAGDRDPFEAMVVLAQPLPGRGQRGAARALAAARIALAEAELGREEQLLLRDLRRGWADLYALTRELVVLSETHELVDLLVATSSILYGSGQAGIGAPLAAQLELSRHDLDVEAAESRLRAAAAALAARVGTADAGAWPRVAALPDVVLPRLEPSTAAPVALDTVVAGLRVALVEREVEAVRAGLSPAWTVGGGILLMDGRDPNLVARVGVELPFFRRARELPRLEAAQARLEAERARRRGAELDARAALTRWLADGRRLETVRRRYLEGLLPQSAAAFEAARSELVAGRAPLSEALMRFEEWYHTRIDLARAEADLYVAWAEIEALTASPLPASAPTNVAGGPR